MYSNNNLSNDEAAVVQTLLLNGKKEPTGKKSSAIQNITHNIPSTVASPRSHAAAAAMRALGNIDLLANLSSEMVVRGGGSSTKTKPNGAIINSLQKSTAATKRQTEKKTTKLKY